MNTHYTSAEMTSAGNTSHESKSSKPEVQQLIVVSTLWTLGIATLIYMSTHSEDMRIKLLLVLALLIGVPIVVWTFIIFSKRKDT